MEVKVNRHNHALTPLSDYSPMLLKTSKERVGLRQVEDTIWRNLTLTLPV